MKLTRRGLIAAGLAGSALSAGPAWAAQSKSTARVVVIGGGFGGATAARFIKHWSPNIDVTLVEPNATYTACPLSNEVIAGDRKISQQVFDYQNLRAALTIRRARAIAIDEQSVSLDDGRKLLYDRVVLSPGIDLRFDALPGYDQAAAEILPHAWKAGGQTELLARQLRDMSDGGTVVLAVPANPYRCPPGPYERASLIAHYLKTQKPRSKIIVLDSKDNFSKQKLFQSAWAALYPDHLEWVGLSQGGKVISVDAKAKTVTTDFATISGDVINVIPPQRAAKIAIDMGLADQTGWCPIDPVSFESKLRPRVHIIGDAAIAGAMPKSAFAANAQAKACAAAVIQLLSGEVPDDPRLINTCYSLVAPDYGISVAGIYQPANGVLADIQGAGGTSALDAPLDMRAQEAQLARDWFGAITAEVFG
jgi:NADPH-dependent 2,4-dienoyl-CoA reductase/sulfur reductase-like enzyme